MKRVILCCLALAFSLNWTPSAAQSFSMEDILKYPLPSGLTSSATGSRIAWAFNEQGKRNVYVAEGPQFTARKLTDFQEDDGQELSSISISDNGKWVVFVRGGDHGGRNGSAPINPASLAVAPKTEIWIFPFNGGAGHVVGEGDNPVITRKSDRIAFIRNGQVWFAETNGTAPAKILFNSRGTSSALQWSPDGSSVCFVSSRGDHSFIGVYSADKPHIQWLAPAFSRDSSPKWSPDGKKVVFVRSAASGGIPDSILARKPVPWSLWVADVAEGSGKVLWSSPNTLKGSMPTTDGGVNLHWTPGGSIVFLSYHDGWPHLYSIKPGDGAPLLLTPGNFMTEYIRLSPDGKWLLFSANAGLDSGDIDRRHIARVPVDKANIEILTPGKGIEAFPALTADGTLAMISSTSQQPPMPAVMSLGKGKTVRVLGKELLPKEFPAAELVTPKQVVYTAPDGVKVNAQLFEPVGVKPGTKKPAVVFVHGGPQRQMLLGWHYGDYYANTYAVNQYLANLGFVVLSVNYRLGIGYGHDFHKPANAGGNGASEYQDIKAAGEWLAARSDIDPKRIGIYGGSYGGFLVALALGKDSGLFAAGVDIHGVHSRSVTSEGSEKAADADLAARVAWESSPVAYVDTWTSPVLLIHADDDHNVDFSQSVDLARRFEQKGFRFEQLVIPDDTHHWMKFSNQLKVDKAIADFLKRKLLQ